MCVLRRAVNRHVQERFDYEQLDDFEDLPIPESGVGLLVPNCRLFMRPIAPGGGDAATQAGGNEIKRDR
jgi:hypothetical protein